MRTTPDDDFLHYKFSIVDYNSISNRLPQFKYTIHSSITQNFSILTHDGDLQLGGQTETKQLDYGCERGK
jgi:hypothetical protein